MLHKKATADLIQIVANGGGLDFDAGGKGLDDLLQIARTAAMKKVPVIMRGVSARAGSQLVQIAAAGGGMVVLGD